MKVVFKLRIAIVILIVVLFVCLDVYQNKGIKFIRKPNYLSKEEIDSRLNEYMNKYTTQTKKELSVELRKKKEAHNEKKQELLKKAYGSEKREEQEELLINIEEIILEEFKENE